MRNRRSKQPIQIQRGWLSLGEACTYAGVSRDTLNTWIDDGLKISRIGERIDRIKPANIDEYVERFERSESGMDEITAKVTAGIKQMGVK